MALMVTHLPFGTDVAKGILENLVAVPEGFGYAFYCYSIIVLFFCITFEYLLVRVIAWRFNFLLGKY